MNTQFVGITLVGKNAGTTTVTSNSGTSQASGSNFYVAVTCTAAAGLTISDNQGNTGKFIPLPGNPITDGSSRWVYRYLCTRGTGGAGHTVTATALAATYMSIAVDEIEGGLAFGALAQSNAHAPGFTALPLTSNNVTTTIPCELAISGFTDGTFAAGLNFAESSGFTVQQQNTDGTSLTAFAMGSKYLATIGTYAASWTETTAGASANCISWIDTFYAAVPVYNAYVSHVAFSGSHVITINPVTAGNSLIVSSVLRSLSTTYTSVAVTDNASGGSDTYVPRGIGSNGSDQRTAAINDCLNMKGGVTSITITPAGGGGGMYGFVTILEVGNLTAVDHVTNGTWSSSPLTLTAGSIDTTGNDLVIGLISAGNNNSGARIKDPAVSRFPTTAQPGSACKSAVPVRRQQVISRTVA